MKIRIFALAKELDMDSKVLIKHCNDAGVKVKSSALASVMPEERDIVLAYLKEQGETSSDSSTESEESLAPVRVVAAEIKKKVRSIKAMVHRGQSSLIRKHKRVEQEAPEDPEEPENSEEPEAETPEVVEVEPEEKEVAAPIAEATKVTKAVDLDDVKEQDSGPKVKPLSRDDYVPVGGSLSTSIREMTPRASGMANRTRTKAKNVLPAVAAPPPMAQMKPKVEKKGKVAAQKPDLKLTPEVLENQSPLAAHLKKHSESKRDRDSDGQEKRKGAGSVGLVEARQQRREKRKQVNLSDDSDRGGRYRRRPPKRRRKSASNTPLKTEGEIEFPITIRTLAEAIGRPAKLIMSTLFAQGKMVTINDALDEETALELSLELGVDLTIKRGRNIEEELLEQFESEETDNEVLVTRPPIVTILGHVDHGKTTLLDTIRSSNVADGEAGGITQHIASYQVEHKGHKLTFVDTPGHAAFSAMRARGANVTDIIILVVAADDGVMPQTAECISHAKAAGVPIIVAMNKIDLPDANEQKVLQDLSAHEIFASEWGGEVEVIRTSATTGQGIDDLLETILLTAELHELKENPDRPAVGVCLEAFQDEGRGPLAWFLVQKGTLKVGDVVLCGETSGRVRAMYNDQDVAISEAGLSMPVVVAGLGAVPAAGAHFYVMSDIEEAREVVEDRRHQGRVEELALTSGGPRTLEDILGAAREGVVQDLPLVIKADTPGSIEALKSEIGKLEHPDVRVKFLHDGVGGVNESDVSLAGASGAIIVAFHVIAEDRALQLADTEGVDIRRYNIIYEVTDEIKRLLEGMLEPEKVEVSTGRALVLRTFQTSKYGTIAGCRVLQGSIDRSNRVHVIRDQTVLNNYEIYSLRREKEAVKEVRDGMECGIRLDGFNDIKEGDLLEAFRVDKIKRTLD